MKRTDTAAPTDVAVVTFYLGLGFYNGIVDSNKLKNPSENIEVYFERTDDKKTYPDRIFLPRNALTPVTNEKKIAETLETMSKYPIQI